MNTTDVRHNMKMKSGNGIFAKSILLQLLLLVGGVVNGACTV